MKNLILVIFVLSVKLSFSQVIQEETDLAKAYLSALNQNNFKSIFQLSRVEKRKRKEIYCAITPADSNYYSSIDSLIVSNLEFSFEIQNKTINTSNSYNFVSIEIHIEIENRCDSNKTYKHEIIMKLRGNESNEIKKLKIYALSYQDKLYLIDSNSSIW